MRYPTVASVMTTDLVTAGPETTYQELVHLLADHGISAVPVVDGGGVLRGVVSELDLLRKEEFRRWQPPWSLWDWVGGRRRAQAGARTAAELMTSPARTISPEVELDQAAHQLAESGVRRLYVVDWLGRPCGVLSRRDILTPHLRADRELKHTIDEDILRRVIWALPGQVQVQVDEGVVTLSGALDEPGDVELALRLSRALPGVVDVVDRLEPVTGREE